MNMSYCQFQNTQNDFAHCLDTIDEMSEGEGTKLSTEERGAAKALFLQCARVVEAMRETLHLSDDTDITADVVDDFLTTIEDRLES